MDSTQGQQSGKPSLCPSLHACAQQLIYLTSGTGYPRFKTQFPPSPVVRPPFAGRQEPRYWCRVTSCYKRAIPLPASEDTATHRGAYDTPENSKPRTFIDPDSDYNNERYPDNEVLSGTANSDSEWEDLEEGEDKDSEEDKTTDSGDKAGRNTIEEHYTVVVANRFITEPVDIDSEDYGSDGPSLSVFEASSSSESDSDSEDSEWQPVTV